MKKVLGLVTMLALTVGVVGQGQVNFLNFNGTTVNAPVSNAAGDLCDNTYMGQLYAGPDAGSLAAVGDPVSFISGGIISGGTVNIPTVTPAGGAAAVQLRAWASASGATWEEATANPVGELGSSDIISLAATGNSAGSPPSVPVDLVGLNAFDLQVVPEPGTWALLALGLGALALRRRK